MPFYEYQCSVCSHHVEVLQKISDAPLRKCPDCGKSTMQRLISAPVFRLKGAGWYETDFKSEGEQKRNIAGGEEAEAKASDKSDGKESKEAAAAGDAKPADSKPEAKSEPKAEIRSERKSVSKPVKSASPSSKSSPGKSQTSKHSASKPAASKPKAAKSKPVAKKKAKRR
jgi:putative FmdB family regulatory protein